MDKMVKVIEKLETSPKFNKLVWAVVLIFWIYAIAHLISVVRWW